MIIDENKPLKIYYACVSETIRAQSDWNDRKNRIEKYRYVCMCDGKKIEISSSGPFC